MNWQPIETAPKDGEQLLLCEHTGYISTGSWYETKFSKGYWDCGCDDGLGIAAKYWMPLPPPPKELT